MSPTLKRILKIGGITIAVIVLLIVGAAAVVLGPFLITRQPIVDGFEFDGMRFLQDGIVSLAVVPAGPNRVVLIDGGNDTSGEAILAELSRRNLTPDAVLETFWRRSTPRLSFTTIAPGTGSPSRLGRETQEAAEADNGRCDSGRIENSGPPVRLGYSRPEVTERRLAVRFYARR